MGGGAFSGELFLNEQEEEVELEDLAFVPARWLSLSGTEGRQSMGTEAGSWVDGAGTSSREQGHRLSVEGEELLEV